MQWGWYQKDSRVVPPGIATFSVRMLLPLNGDAEPSCAAYEPLWWALLTTRGSRTPLGVQPLRSPVSKPPLTTPAGGVVTVRATFAECVALEPVPVTVIV